MVQFPGGLLSATSWRRGAALAPPVPPDPCTCLLAARQEMEKAARVMQEDMPLTFQDMQRTSKEFEILGKQLNYLTGVVVSACRCVNAWWW